MINSESLLTAQKTLEHLVKLEIDRPDTDYNKAKAYLAIIEDIDGQRRGLWNNEHFGAYDAYESDDIPF